MCLFLNHTVPFLLSFSRKLPFPSRNISRLGYKWYYFFLWPWPHTQSRWELKEEILSSFFQQHFISISQSNFFTFEDARKNLLLGYFPRVLAHTIAWTWIKVGGFSLFWSLLKKNLETNDTSFESSYRERLESRKKLGVASPWGWPQPLNWKSTTSTQNLLEPSMVEILPLLKLFQIMGHRTFFWGI